MVQFGAVLRSAAVLCALSLGATTALPAMAAQADIDLLKSYIGTWEGEGILVGAFSQPVVCKLNLQEGNGQQVTYSGRCTVFGSILSVSGTMAYVDEAKRYEAVMTSNIAFSGAAVGKKHRGGLVFDLHERDSSEGQELVITAGIALNRGKINVDFRVIEAATGRSIEAAIPFEK